MEKNQTEFTALEAQELTQDIKARFATHDGLYAADEFKSFMERGAALVEAHSTLSAVDYDSFCLKSTGLSAGAVGHLTDLHSLILSFDQSAPAPDEPPSKPTASTLASLTQLPTNDRPAAIQQIQAWIRDHR